MRPPTTKRVNLYREKVIDVSGMDAEALKELNQQWPEVLHLQCYRIEDLVAPLRTPPVEQMEVFYVLFGRRPYEMTRQQIKQLLDAMVGYACVIEVDIHPRPKHNCATVSLLARKQDVVRLLVAFDFHVVVLDGCVYISPPDECMYSNEIAKAITTVFGSSSCPATEASPTGGRPPIHPNRGQRVNLSVKEKVQPARTH